MQIKSLRVEAYRNRASDGTTPPEAFARLKKSDHSHRMREHGAPAAVVIKAMPIRVRSLPVDGGSGFRAEWGRLVQNRVSRCWSCHPDDHIITVAWSALTARHAQSVIRFSIAP